MNGRVRRRLALLTLAATMLAAPAPAAAVERVSMKPRHGDVNTRFVFRGTGWRPDTKLVYEYGAYCAASLACPAVGIMGYLRSDANGEFAFFLDPWDLVPDDFVGTDYCFAYEMDRDCKALKRVGRRPASVSATPTRARLLRDGGGLTMSVLAEHFKAGERLTIHVRYPDGRHRAFKARARRRGARVEFSNAWVPRGGALKWLKLQRDDPVGTYQVRVVDRHRAEARTSFVAYAD